MTQSANPRRRFRRAPNEKRARIIAVARECFREKPYADATTAEIARRADVAEGTVFHHFGSKLGLLKIVADEYSTELCREMLEDVLTRRLSYRETLSRAHAFLEREGLPIVLTQTSRDDEALSTVLRALRERILHDATRVLEGFQSEGACRAIDAPLTARILFPITERLLIDAFLEGRGRPSEEELDEATRLIEGALALEL